MLISDKHRLILMLPQKCASTTLQVRLGSIRDVPRFGGPSFCDQSTGRVISKHVQLKDAVRFPEYGDRRDYLKACFVRNPYDRIYSWYRWLERRVKNFSDPESRGKILREFEQTMEPDAVRRAVEMLEKNREALEKAGFDFNAFIRNQPGRFAPISRFTHLGGRLEMDFIGRVENFEKDFRRLCAAIGYSDYSLESSNILSGQSDALSGESGLHSKYIERYDRRSIQLVNRHHSEDFKCLDYPKVRRGVAVLSGCCHFLRKKANMQPPLFHVTHAKAGSTWIHKILKISHRDRICERLGGNLGKISVKPGDIHAALFCDYEKFMQIKGAPGSPCFFVMRDIRDTMVSLYFSHRYSHISNPVVDRARSEMEGMSDEQAILLYMEHKARTMMDLQASWLKSPLPVYRYEDLFESRGLKLLEILDEVGFEFDRKRLTKAINACWFEKEFKRKPGQVDIKSHGRSGLPGGWRAYRTPELDAVIERNLAEHLRLTGYES